MRPDLPFFLWEGQPLHLAGSGRTKEIAWLAHDLSTLHRDDTVQAANPELVEQAQASSRGDFITDRDELLIDAALTSAPDRERQARLLKALIDDDDFRLAPARDFGSIYDAAAGREASS